MNIYMLFVDGQWPIYVRASYSFFAVRYAEMKLGVRVSAWDIATSLPSGAHIHDSAAL